jgi:hypothetical protein
MFTLSKVPINIAMKVKDLEFSSVNAAKVCRISSCELSLKLSIKARKLVAELTG